MEESSENQQPRCPCGFWGSAQTLGLCSKCYREAERNQTQSNLRNSDSGKSAVGNCHNQLRNRNTHTSRMDSKHFPSHSTTDNLPSSLSSPGERSALTAALPPPSTVDTSLATSSTSGTPVLLPTNIGTASSAGEKMSPGGISVEASRSSPSQITSDTSLSSVSTDQTYDSKQEEDICSLGSCSSVSVANSITVSYSSSSSLASGEDCLRRDTNVAGGVLNASNLALTRSMAITAASSCVKFASSSSKDSNVAEQCTTASSYIKNNSLQMQENEISKPASVATQTSTAPEMKVSQKEEESPTKRGIKRSRAEMEASEKSKPAETFPQKKKRCFTCSCKLELAQRTIGRCRCDRIFCALHRLPELHHCDFNHKEDGRREAREKMIVPTRHLGTSFRRDDHS